MKKIREFNIRRLFVDELGSLGRSILTLVKPLVTLKQIPEPLVAGLEQGIKRYEVGVGPKVDKVGTERSRQLDCECDNLIQAIKGAVRMAKFRTPELRVAAQRLEDAICNRGWNMQNSAYDVESNSIKLLLADIKASPQLQADSVLIKCDDLLVLLGDRNTTFDTSESDRKEQELAQGGINSYEAIKGVIVEIQRIFDYLNSVSAVYPEVATAIDQINLLIDPLVAKIKTRATIAEKNKEHHTPPKN